MWKFIIGLATGYLTFTDEGKKLSSGMMAEVKKNASSFLKKEGVIEDEKPTTNAGHTEPVSTDDKPEEQPSTGETVNE